MGVQHLKLRGMIDRALGHPEKGIVNLNILHSLLHEILNHLDKEETNGNINNQSMDSQRGETDNLSETQQGSRLLPRPDGQTPHENVESTECREHAQSYGKEQSNLSEFEERLSSIESKLDALNNLSPEKSFLEETSQSDTDQNGAINKENALAMMWKYMTIHRRVQATEEAVDKIMNILNDVMKDAAEMKKVKCHLDKLRDEQQKMAGEFDAVKRGEGFEFNSEKFHSLGAIALKKDLAPFVTWSALEQALNKSDVKKTEIVVTNDSGENDVSAERPVTAPSPSNTRDISIEQQPPRSAMSPKEFTKLTGKNPEDPNTFTSIQDTLSSKENIVGETSLLRNSDEISQADTKDSTTQPSSEFLNQLNRIGELPKQYDDVAVQVSMMSELQSKLAGDVQKVEVDILPRKVDKEDLQLPENLVEQIDMLKQGLDILNTNKDLQMLATIKDTSVQNKENIDSLKAEMAMLSQHLKRLSKLEKGTEHEANNIPSYDQEVLNSVREKLSNVEEEQEKMVLKSKEDINKILENLDEKQKIIDDLFKYAERLQERKADRENVATEMDIKADKHALESKVNQSTFDETFQIFDKGLQEALQKMEDYMNEEIALKDTLSRISREMEGKLDNDSLQLMKDYFERQIKDVQESRDKFARETRVDATDAAGVRRKLPIHYHCISCNRPVDLPVRDSEPALPESESLPFRRMKIPFTSYEVEQLRQKSVKGGYNADESAAMRDLASSRPCGGSHTVINSHLRKSTKFHQFTQAMAVREDSRFVPKMVREVSVLDYLRGSDGHYYKGRSRQILPAIPSRNKYPSNADTSTDSGSYKGNGALPEETLQANDQQKTGSHYLLRTPSPPPQDNLSSSYPEISDAKAPHVQGKRYSSDDLNLPSNTALNRESLKIFRRRRGQDKEQKRQRCWDNQSNTREGNQEQRSDSNHSSTPKSMKRTTPVGEEQPHISSPQEKSPWKHDGPHDTTEDKTRISDDKD